MGERGPIRGAKASRLRVLPAPASNAPPVPLSLAADGRALWVEVWSASWLHPEQDRALVLELAEAVDERVRWRDVLDRLGLVLSEPIVTPTGAVVGERVVVNPAEAALRRVERRIADLRAVLGLSPAARARLGLAHLAAARRAEQILEGRRRKEGLGDG